MNLTLFWHHNAFTPQSTQGNTMLVWKDLQELSSRCFPPLPARITTALQFLCTASFAWASVSPKSKPLLPLGVKEFYRPTLAAGLNPQIYVKRRSQNSYKAPYNSIVSRGAPVGVYLGETLERLLSLYCTVKQQLTSNNKIPTAHKCVLMQMMCTQVVNTAIERTSLKPAFSFTEPA